MFQLLAKKLQHSLHPSLSFIWHDLMNEAGRRYTIYTTLIVLIGAGTGILAPYGLGLIFNGVANLDQKIFFYGITFFVCLRVLDDFLNKKRIELRERVFQQNFWHIPQRLTELFLRQPLGAYVNTDNSVDGGGVESVNDKVWNVQASFLFNIIPNWSITFFGLMACMWVDIRLGVGALLYIIVECYMARKHNKYMSNKMFPIAEDFRSWQKRNRAKWDAIALVKSNGVEQRTIQEVHDEVQPALLRDDALWRIWFAKAITLRRSIDLVALVLLYCSGGAWLAFAGKISLEQFVLLCSSFARITIALQEVAGMQREVQKELARIETYRVQLIRPTLIPYDVGDGFKEKEVGIEYRNVCLSLGTNGSERMVLRNVSFAVASGERVGIVGPSGAGKTQLINLLLRAYDPDSGSIMVGGTDIQTVAPCSWLSHVGYVPQDPTIFDTSIRTNVRFGAQTLPFSAKNLSIF